MNILRFLLSSFLWAIDVYKRQGLGLHDKYGKEDRRNFQLQEIPMMAAVEYNKLSLIHILILFAVLYTGSQTSFKGLFISLFSILKDSYFL